MLEQELVLESLHHAWWVFVNPHFQSLMLFPEHQSLAKPCSTDEGITKGLYTAGNGLGFSGEQMF